MSLRQQAVSGIKWTSISAILVAGIQLIQLVILTHYLEASHFGLIAIVTVIIGFSALFMDMGISASIIHRQDITCEQLSSLYWLNIASGMILFFIVYHLAPILADFYNETELIPLIQLLAITFIISAVGNQHGILFQKHLKFNVIAKISIISSLATFFVAISLAMNGYGVYSLIYASLTNAIVISTLNVVMGLKDHRPAFVYRHSEITPMISFGIFQMGERGINYFNSQFDVMLIGKLLGVEVLGIYSVAKNLSMYPSQTINPIITKVSFPIMAKIQNDMPKLKNIYLKTVNYLSSINFPIYILMAILAEPIVLILFGEKWSDSIIVLQILSIYGAIRSTGNPIGSLLLAKGRADLGFYWNLGLFFLIPISIYLGSFRGVEGVAYALVVIQIIIVIPGWYFMVKKLCGAGFKEYFQQILSPFVVAVTSGLLSLIAMGLMSNIFMELILVCATYITIYFALSFYLNRSFFNMLIELWD